MASFFTSEAKKVITGAVKSVESKSSAEIVVTVRQQSDEYRDVALTMGAVTSLVTLFALFFHPADMWDDLIPVGALFAFVITTVLVSKITPLKRMLVSRRRMVERSLQCARAHFVEQGVSVTRDRSGILVYVSLLERTACVVVDVGIDQSKLGEAWLLKLRALEKAVEAEDPPAFAAALTEIGPLLEGPYPRREDDVNELPDAPDMGETGAAA